MNKYTLYVEFIKGLKFACTCSGCPEQYDVFDSNDNIVGYVRLRYGALTCQYPDIGGELIYEASVGDDWTGSFESDEQREHYLNVIANKILKKANTINIEENAEFCDCFKSEDKDEYWGHWIKCECGYDANTTAAKFCGGCGKKINVVGTMDFYPKY